MGRALSERETEILRSYARRIDPSDAGAHNNLGVLYFRKGLVEEAIEQFRAATEFDSKMTVAQRNLEFAYTDTGYYDRRIAQLRERLRKHPDDRDARSELGLTYTALGQFDAGIAEYGVMLGNNTDDVAGMTQIGLAEKQRGNLAAATEWFRRVVELELLVQQRNLASQVHPQLHVLNVIVAVKACHHGVDAHAVDCGRGAAPLQEDQRERQDNGYEEQLGASHGGPSITPI